MDSVIHHLNNWGQDYTKICSVASLTDKSVIRFLQHAQVIYQIPLASAMLLVNFFSAKNIFSLFAFECDFFRHFSRYKNSLL